MSIFTQLGFKAYYDNLTGPFRNDIKNNISGLTVQQLCEDIADSVLFQDQVVNTDRNYFESDDLVYDGAFLSGLHLGPHQWSTFFGGAGAAISGAPLPGFGMDAGERAFGVVTGSTGTTAAGTASFYKGAVRFGIGHSLRIRMRVALSVLSTGAQRYTMHIGFGNNIVTGDVVDGCCFRYTDSVNGGKWEAVNSFTSVQTAQDTGVAPVAGVYSIFEVRMNAAGNSAQFYINDNLTNTIATNIPQNTRLLMKIEKSIGATPALLWWDWYDFLVSISSAR